MMEVRQVEKKRMWAMLSSLRLTFTILLFTFVSWLVHRQMEEGERRFRIVGRIEKGKNFHDFLLSKNRFITRACFEAL